MAQARDKTSPHVPSCERWAVGVEQHHQERQDPGPHSPHITRSVALSLCEPQTPVSLKWE